MSVTRLQYSCRGLVVTLLSLPYNVGFRRELSAPVSVHLSQLSVLRVSYIHCAESWPKMARDSRRPCRMSFSSWRFFLVFAVERSCNKALKFAYHGPYEISLK